MAKFPDTATSSLRICQILPFSWHFSRQIRVICHVTKKKKEGKKSKESMDKHFCSCFWRENYQDCIRLAEHSRSSCFRFWATNQSILTLEYHNLTHCGRTEFADVHSQRKTRFWPGTTHFGNLSNISEMCRNTPKVQIFLAKNVGKLTPTALT